MDTISTIAQGRETDEPTIRRLELALGEVSGARPVITRLRRRAYEGATSFGSEILELEIEDGPAIELFLKDYGHSLLPRGNQTERARREIAVYRDLLAGAGLGTAAYHGAVWESGRRWLLLEYVRDAPDLRAFRLQVWIEAAAWLGRLHGRFNDPSLLAKAGGSLSRHDGAFFRGYAHRAIAAVAAVDKALSERLKRVLAGYGPLADLMASQPPTLVHGSYRPQNILVGPGPARRRICPVDWEHAGLGSSLYDLALLARGFRGPDLACLVDAWRQEAESRHAPVPGRAHLRVLLDCFRLHWIARSLSDAITLRYERSAIEKFIEMGEELRASLG